MYFKSLHVLNLCGGSTLICRQKFKPPSTIATLPLCSQQKTLNSWNRISSIKISKTLLLKHHQTSCRFILLRLRRILQNSKRCVSRHRRQRWLSHYSCNATNLLGHGFPHVSSKIWSNHEWHIVTPHPPHLPYKKRQNKSPWEGVVPNLPFSHWTANLSQSWQTNPYWKGGIASTPSWQCFSHLLSTLPRLPWVGHSTKMVPLPVICLWRPGCPIVSKQLSQRESREKDRKREKKSKEKEQRRSCDAMNWTQLLNVEPEDQYSCVFDSEGGREDSSKGRLVQTEEFRQIKHIPSLWGLHNLFAVETSWFQSWFEVCNSRDSGIWSHGRCWIRGCQARSGTSRRNALTSNHWSGAMKLNTSFYWYLLYVVSVSINRSINQINQSTNQRMYIYICNIIYNYIIYNNIYYIYVHTFKKRITSQQWSCSVAWETWMHSGLRAQNTIRDFASLFLDASGQCTELFSSLLRSQYPWSQRMTSGWPGSNVSNMGNSIKAFDSWNVRSENSECSCSILLGLSNALVYPSPYIRTGLQQSCNWQLHTDAELEMIGYIMCK